MKTEEKLSNKSNPVSKEEFDTTTKKLDILLTGVVVVLFIGFVTVLIAAMSPIIDAWRFRASSYDNLVNKVNEQSNKIDNLNLEIQSLANQHGAEQQVQISKPFK